MARKGVCTSSTGAANARMQQVAALPAWRATKHPVEGQPPHGSSHPIESQENPNLFSKDTEDTHEGGKQRNQIRKGGRQSVQKLVKKGDLVFQKMMMKKLRARGDPIL